ncbi:MAG TPA: glycosyltransferase family 2 protein, partial [Opitutaceae bacterium]|nr:glycosyltransferase family 2 protein [Opitutaceae bacterium]
MGNRDRETRYNLSLIPAISTVICTHNRCALLREALASLTAQSLPSSQFEVIVVDDGSTDATPIVAMEFAGTLPLTVLTQPNGGLSAARNAGWRAARAPLVAYLDDDARAASDWLERILAAFAAAPAAAVVGGPVHPRWETSRPAWLPDDLLLFLTIFDLGPQEIRSDKDPVFAGASMAMQRSWLEATGGFDQRLGRRGSSLLSHEESAWWEMARDRGGFGLYRPDIVVDHFVPAARATRTWFRRRLYWEGVSMQVRAQAVAPRRHALSRFARALNYLRVQVLSGSSLGHVLRPWRWSREFSWQCHVCYQTGVAVTMLQAT